MPTVRETVIGIALCLVLLFGPVLPAIYWNEPAWLWISLVALVFMLAG